MPETPAKTSDEPEGCAASACSIFEVPVDVATCPECGGDLEGEVDGGDDVSVSVTVWCPTYLAEEGDEDTHRCWQSDWQPVIDRVTEWVNKSNDQGHRPADDANRV